MTNRARLRLGTRGSELARWQADWIAAQLAQLGVEVEMISITTEGDARREPLGQIGGVGVFTKEIQRALLEERIDLAVHSLKDLPTDEVAGLALAAVPERESPGDVLVSNVASRLQELPAEARVGTGSLRRRAQLLHLRPDLKILDIRGNIDTRLRKLDEGEYEAIILAEAGLRRLGMSERIGQVLPWREMLPAVGQGALGVEARAADVATREILTPLNHADTRQAVLAERAMLATLRGGCLAPVGAWGRMEEGLLWLDGVVLDGDGTQRVVAAAAAAADQAVEMGQQVAQRLLEQGAGELIAASRSGGTS